MVLLRSIASLMCDPLLVTWLGETLASKASINGKNFLVFYVRVYFSWALSNIFQKFQINIF